MAADSEILQKVNDVGPVVAHNIEAYFHQANNDGLVKRLLGCGITWPLVEPQESLDGKLKGASFVVTGTLESLTREEAKQRILDCGGKVVSSVSKKTNYLVAGDKAGSKLSKAQKLGITVLNETEFLTMLEENG